MIKEKLEAFFSRALRLRAASFQCVSHHLQDVYQVGHVVRNDEVLPHLGNDEGGEGLGGVRPIPLDLSQFFVLPVVCCVIIELLLCIYQLLLVLIVLRMVMMLLLLD